MGDEGLIMNATRIGLDIAKQVFQVHGVEEHGKVVIQKTLRRDPVVKFFGQMPPCLIGIEACGRAHYWARTSTGLGHTVRLMAGQFVAPYRKRCQRCRGYLRGGRTTDPALCGGEE